jgi:hypothetical protein
MKLSVIALLTGTLALVGCGDDGGAGTAGSGGSGATGGSGGSGATGGSGGSGGSAMVPVCGEGRTLDPAFTMDEANIACVVLGGAATLDLTIVFAGNTEALMTGTNDFDLQMEVVITADTVNGLIGFGVTEATFNLAVGTAVTTAGSDPAEEADIPEDPVPCSLAFTMDEGAGLVTPVVNVPFTLNDGTTQTLDLEGFSGVVNALGMDLTISTDPEGGCTWENDTPPSISFDVPQ